MQNKFIYIIMAGLLALSPTADVQAGEEHDHDHAEGEHDEAEHTKITPEAAESSGIKTEPAGPATIREKIALSGRISLDPNRTAFVKARYPGVVRAMHRNLGDAVKAGDVLAEVESNNSLQVYPIKSPISGVVLERSSNVGDVAGSDPLYQVADLSQVWAEFHVFPRHLSRIKQGQRIYVKSVEGDAGADAVIAAVPPVAQAHSQSVLARVVLDNKDGKWRTGIAVQGGAVVSEREVKLAIKTSGLQRMRDSDVVFAKEGDAYEACIVKLGTNDGEHAEVLGGIEPGTHYVTQNSFIIKADIEKSGAAHEH